MTTPEREGATREFRAEATLASAALRSLRLDLVVITSTRADGRSEIVASAGDTRGSLDAIGGWLRQTEAGVGQVRIVLGGDQLLHRIGFRTACWAPAALDGSRLGAIHGFSTGDRAVDTALIDAFAAHCAVVLARSELDRTVDVSRGQPERIRAVDLIAPSVSGFPELIARIDEALSEIFGPAICGAMVWDTERHVLQMVAGSFGARTSVTASYQVNAGDLYSNAARVFELQCAYVTNHAQGDPAVLQDFVAAFGIERLLSVPLRVGDRAVGVLHLANKESDFTVIDIETLEDLCSRIALVVEMTWMLLRERRQQRIETVLSRVAQAVAEGAATKRLLSANLSELQEAVGTNTIILAPDGNEPIVVKSDGSKGESEQFREVIREARDLQGERAHVVQPHGAGDPGTAAFHVPVRLGERQVGTLSALRDRAERFAVGERLALARMAHLASMTWAADAVSRQQTLLARMGERQRIADDLHDDVSQLLFAAQMQIDAMLEQGSLDAAIAEPLARTQALIGRGDAAIREVIAALSRPAPASLVERLHELADSLGEEFEIPVRLEISADGRTAAEQARESINETILKVARESLVNAAKHAGPCRISLRLESHEDTLRLRIVDDGVGVQIGLEEGHYGIASLRRAVQRRGGSLDVRRATVGGTVISATLPL